MHSRSNRKRSTWFKRLKNIQKPTLAEDAKPPHDMRIASNKYFGFLSPEYKFYAHAIQTNPRVFYRFALQSRSVEIRDVYAKAASFGRLTYRSLLSEIEENDRLQPQGHNSLLVEPLEPQVLLWLADLVANTAQSEMDTHDALVLYDYVLSVHGTDMFTSQSQLQYIEALGEAGRYQDLSRVSIALGIQTSESLQLTLLNIQRIRRESSSNRLWLEALNALFSRMHLMPLTLIDDETLPLLDRLRGIGGQEIEGPKVSVIMPTYSPGAGITTAIRSLLEQTWKNIEILVVDDASPPEYAERFAAVAQMSPKVRVLHLSENSGAYVARNAGLAEATGDFITTHDDDDWSHPEKIAIQVRALLDNEAAVATTSAHIRVTEDMNFRRMNMQARFMQMNYSSLLFRASIVEEIGSWDTVNRGGDSEFLTRITENFGSDKLIRLLDRPLSFSRVWAGSLTSGEMSRGYFANSRLLYRWAFRQWHWSTSKQEGPALQRHDSPRQYPVPTTFEPGARNKDLGLFDVIYVTDYFRQAKFVDDVLRELKILIRYGFRVGYLHLDSPRTTRAAGFPPELFEMQLKGEITQISHDDTAETKLLLVVDDAIGMFLDRFSSTVRSRRGLVVSHQSEPLSGGELRTPTAIRPVLRHLDQSFNVSFQVIGATMADQKRLLRQAPRSRVLDNELLWNKPIDGELAQIKPLQGLPIVGFHSYGNKYRWPTNNDIFRRVYVSSKYKTRIYGHLTPARLTFDEDLLEEVDLIHFQDKNEHEFLDSIDFWVYHPHYRLRDHNWHPILRAMQAGKVVILPKSLEDTYGSAAIYSGPDDVEQLVTTYATDSELYMEQAQQAQSFIRKYYTPNHLIARIRKLTSDR